MPLEKKRKRALLPVFITYFLDNFGLAIIYPVFSRLLLNPTFHFFYNFSSDFERSLLLGLLLVIFPLAQFFGAPLIGVFSDRFGRKRAFYCTILGMSIGYTLTAIAILTLSIPLLFISRLITGFFAGNLIICLASIADMSPDERSRTKNFGQLSTLGGLSFIVAILVGWLFSDPNFYYNFNASIPFWITAVISYLNFILILLLFHETHPIKAAVKQPLKEMNNIRAAWENPSLRTLFFVSLFFKLSWIGSINFYPSFLIRHFSYDPTQILYTLVIMCLIWCFVNLFINNKLTERIHPQKSLLYSLLIFSVLLFAQGIHVNSLFFFSFFYTSIACAALCWTNTLVAVSMKAPPEHQGSVLGMNQSMSAIAGIILSAPLAFVLHSGNHLVFVAAGVSSLVAFLILKKIGSKKNILSS